jgi:hypothetical protein
MDTCQVTDCSKPRKYTSYCGKHYTQLYRHGKVLEQTRVDKRPAIIEGNIAKIPLGVDASAGYAIVDKNFAYLAENNWHKTNSGYAVRGLPIVNGKREFEIMHRVIKEATISGFVQPIDHINGDRLDNRLENLREATVSQNSYNRGKMANNKSGFKGVAWHKKSKRFRATICVETKRMYIGMYRTAVEAAQAYDKKALELHGEFARINNV